MTRLARAFLAVVPPTPVLDALAERIEGLAPTEPPVRWLPRQQWHVTLQFLGAVDDAEALADAVGSVVAELRPFAARLAGGGAFPSAQRATVLWAGVEDPAPLAALAEAVGHAIARLGYSLDERAYHPHVTVARAPRPRSLSHLVEGLGAGPLGPRWTVEDLALVVSDTRPQGAVHTEWTRRPLGA